MSIPRAKGDAKSTRIGRLRRMVWSRACRLPVRCCFQCENPEKPRKTLTGLHTRWWFAAATVSRRRGGAACCRKLLPYKALEPSGLLPTALSRCCLGICPFGTFTVTDSGQRPAPPNKPADGQLLLRLLGFLSCLLRRCLLGDFLSCLLLGHSFFLHQGSRRA